MTVTTAPDIRALMAAEAAELELTLAEVLPDRVVPERRLYQAMRHGTLGGGKRLRPFLLLSAARLFGVPRSRALRAAAAVELVHCYSLIHDDLPAMDDSPTRRGLPSVHALYDPATAILAGDGLLALAFEVMAHPATHEDGAVRCQLISGLAAAAGPQGMVGGQTLDMLASGQIPGDVTLADAAAITRLQRLKTGELIAFATVAGGILGRADTAHKGALKAYANAFGLAFQIVDDLLDLDGDAATLGKPVGADAGKATFVALLGRERAREQAALLTRQAKAHLEVFEGRARVLEALADFMLDRKS